MTHTAVGTSAPSQREIVQAQGDGRLRDQTGRVGRDLRVSLTDRCTLRCRYCMPEEGLAWLSSESLLTDDEVIRLITIAVRDLGVEEVRFTGGEPLLRNGLEHILAGTTALRTASGQSPDTAMTTNGIGLEHRARALKAAGLRRINVSLDTLDRASFAAIARRDRLGDVMAGLAAAAEAGLAPIKINTVLMRGVNDQEAVPLVRWALARGFQLRFIEQMPLGPSDAWQRDDVITAADILALLQSELTLVPAPPGARGSSPAELWTVPGVQAPDGMVPTVGIIASVTRSFCDTCDRTRLTADGQLRNCLFAREETDLRSLLRGGAGDAEIAQLWRDTMWRKQSAHGIDQATFVRPERRMSAIGG